MKTRYAGIVLAGGLSTRMKQFKPLLPLGNVTVIDHVIDTFLDSGVDVVLVLGFRRNEIMAGIRKRGISIVVNPDYERGMFSSIQAGIKHLSSEGQAFFILPVDIPLVRPATIRSLIQAGDQNPEKIIYPSFGGQRGHPPLIPTKFSPAILEWHKEGGLKAFLESQEKLAEDIPVADSHILFDIDTPEDYIALQERFRRYDIPSDEECSVILNDICKVDEDRIKHSAKVAELAVTIGSRLQASGQDVNVDIIRAAALLHDIAKGQRHHDMVGGKLLKDMGFEKVGNIVGVHSDLAGGNINFSLETKVVFLADKLVEGERFVSLEQRYSSAIHRFGLTSEAEEAILSRLEVAGIVKRDIEHLLGLTLESLIS